MITSSFDDYGLAASLIRGENITIRWKQALT